MLNLVPVSQWHRLPSLVRRACQVIAVGEQIIALGSALQNMQALIEGRPGLTHSFMLWLADSRAGQSDSLYPR